MAICKCKWGSLENYQGHLLHIIHSIIHHRELTDPIIYLQFCPSLSNISSKYLCSKYLYTAWSQMIPTHVTKCILRHMQHIIRIHSCSWLHNFLNVIRNVRSGTIGGDSQTKQILKNVIIKCKIKFINYSVIYSNISCLVGLNID